jgi:hypothetical protein
LLYPMQHMYRIGKMLRRSMKLFDNLPSGN